MRQRLALRRILLQRLFRLQTTRPFTSNTSLTSGGRPQLPFLTIPVTTRPRVRYFTTEKKHWLRYESRLFLRYNVSIWGGAACILAIMFLLHQEGLEKEFPTPHEWSLLTRMSVRGAKVAAKDDLPNNVDWVEVIVSCKKALNRLHNPSIDGAGVLELSEGAPVPTDGLGSAGKDVSAKSENWQRGYYEVLMLAAKAAEQLDGWVKDTTRNIIFPPDVVIGPSNPHPKPIPAGAESAPKEEDCVLAYETAENHYTRILSTKGFTNRQKMDAALAYASFLDFKGLSSAAEEMYKWALSLATETAPSSPPLVNPRTYTINDKTTQPSENVLNVLTSLALHKARNGDVAAALPIFISVLRARRALPQVALPGHEGSQDPPGTIWQRIWKLAKPPTYPPPPDDGTRPPWRHPKELCEEAGLNLYIGEILYAGKDTKNNREEGLAWTRDAVDLAEEQLHKIGSAGGDKEARKTCRECLATGLENWSTMVARLVKEEEAKNKAAPAKSTFGFWSENKKHETRWSAEEKVVKERIRRTRELLINAEPPAAGLASLLRA